MTEPRKTVVYQATNRVNGKRYIGVTIKGVAQRRSDHCSVARSMARIQTPFSRAIRKYGEAAFDFVVRSSWDEYAEALNEEVRLIALERPEYNVTAGGQGVVIDRSTRPLWNERISRALKGRKPSAYSVQVARERALASASITVVCINDGWFGLAVKATKRYSLSKSAIYTLISGRGEWYASRGRVFVAAPEPLSLNEREAHMVRYRHRLSARREKMEAARRRGVICLTDGNAHESVTAAAKHYGIEPMRVVQICHGEGTTKTGLLFMYADQPVPPASVRKTPEERAIGVQKSIAALRRGQQKVKKQVVCLDTGQHFASMTLAAAAIGAKITSLSAAIQRNTRCAGYRFRLAA